MLKLKTSKIGGLRLLAVLLTFGLVAAACAGEEEASNEIIVFHNTSSDTYQAAWQRGMQSVAAENNYEVTFIENNYDQTEQNNQVQQQLGGGTTPAAWVWMPPDVNAGKAALRSLSETGIPVIQANQYPPADTEDYFTLYAGVNDVINGRATGELILEARQQLIDQGKLSADQPAKLSIIRFWPEFGATIARLDGVMSVLQSAIVNGEIELVTGNHTAFNAETGHAQTSAIIPALQNEGVDILYAQNDASAAGAIQALIEGGFTPGDDVLVIGGNCRDDVADLVEGRQFGTGLQGAELEGQFTMQMIVNYLANPTVRAGAYEAPALPDGRPEWPETVSKYNFIPNPPVRGDEVNGFRLWGDTMVNWCSY